uniref:Secreted protein n=1 Tax=Schistocephalus solidus TaxID=70667 RepID=A0A0X3P7M1_SCHSO
MGFALFLILQFSLLCETCILGFGTCWGTRFLKSFIRSQLRLRKHYFHIYMACLSFGHVRTLDQLIFSWQNQFSIVSEMRRNKSLENNSILQSHWPPFTFVTALHYA